MKSLLIVAALSGTAGAEPCPQFGLTPEVVRPNAEVVADGGLVVMEVAKMVDGKAGSDLAKWQVRAGKATKAELTAVAPGLYVVKPPAGAQSYVLEDGGKVKGRAKILTTAPALLPAPSLAKITSGSSTGKHVTRFVTVDLATPAPKGAIALVAVDAKGTALSWGPAGDNIKQVVVYSTQSGCVTRFPNGTQIAQPGDQVTAFWIDATGRKSPASTPITVK